MVLRPAGGAPLQSFAVQGTLGGCDLDMFSFDAAEGDAITARLTPLNGAACPPNWLAAQKPMSGRVQANTSLGASPVAQRMASLTPSNTKPAGMAACTHQTGMP